MATRESLSGSDELLVKHKKTLKKVSYWRGYLLGLGLVCLSTLLGYLVREFFATTNIIMIYLLCVTVSAVFGGLGPSILISVLSVLAFNFFFVPPHLTFAVEDTQYIFTFVVLLLVGMTISYLTSRIRQQTKVAKRREKEMTTLYALGQDLAISSDLKSYVQSIINRIKTTLGHDVMIFLPDVQNKENLKVYNDGVEVDFGSNEFTAAVWSFKHKKMIGYGTDTFANTGVRYLPLVTNRGAVGVMALKKTSATSELTVEQDRLLEAYTDLSAMAIESIQLADELHNTQVLKATEKLQTAILNAISHDLRTPLVSVIGVLSSLQEEGMDLDETSKRNLIQVAREEADRLNHLITNLLDESRLEAGVMTLSRQPSEVYELVDAALKHMGSRMGTRSIKIDLQAEIPFISVDFGLTVEALANVLDNALKYSPTDSPIEIVGRQVAQEVHVEIADRGVGILEQDLTHIFDKFYRIRHPDNVTGTGLGLSISKGIVEAHGGHIEAENRTGGGTIIRLMLPVGESSSSAVEKLNA